MPTWGGIQDGAWIRFSLGSRGKVLEKIIVSIVSFQVVHTPYRYVTVLLFSTHVFWIYYYWCTTCYQGPMNLTGRDTSVKPL